MMGMLANQIDDQHLRKGYWRTNLDEKGVAAFQEASAKGYLPQAEDDEGTKRKAPDCCSPNSTGKS
jgi:hypothetical protein